MSDIDAGASLMESLWARHAARLEAQRFLRAEEQRDCEMLIEMQVRAGLDRPSVDAARDLVRQFANII